MPKYNDRPESVSPFDWFQAQIKKIISEPKKEAERRLKDAEKKKKKKSPPD